MKWQRAIVFASIFLSCLLLVQTFPVDAQAQSRVVANLSVNAGKFARMDVPVSANLDGVPLGLDGGNLQLFEITSGADRFVPSQLLPGAPGQLTWILDGETAPGGIRNFELRVVQGESMMAGHGAVHLEDDGNNLSIRVGDKPVLSYRYTMNGVPDGVREIFDRSGFIHPLWSPGGEVLSRIQPPDHWHHYGLWNPWTSTQFQGRHVDFWNIGSGQGTVRATQVLEKLSGQVAGGFRAALDHVAFDSTGAETIALNEQWAVKAWNVDPEQKVFLVDFVSTLSPASDEPLTITAYRYQGFSLRATEKWGDATATLLSDAGEDKTTGNGTRARWLDVNGISDTEPGKSGILFMSHPANYNYPEQLRIWPTGQNGGLANVYINFNPAQDRDWELKPGNTYALQYRMMIYDGTISVEEAERYWRDFANPPSVAVHPVGALAGARILVYTKNNPDLYVHANIPSSIAAIEKLGADYGFEVVSSDDPAVFTDESLSQFDALVFSNSNNEAFETESQRLALQTYIRNGGAFVGIHSASGSERTWPWFSALLGGNFERHAPSQDFTVEIIDRGHPSTAFLPARWEIINDECYYQDELNPRIHVLLAADMNTVEDNGKAEFPGTLFADRFPVAWYQEFDGGRSWYTALGHRPEEYEDPMFMRHILGGIQWAVNGVGH